jgi:hypothetical protein
MRKMMIVIVLVFLVAVPLVAQQTEETVTIKKSDLTTDQLKKVEAQKITEQLGQYKDWADAGRGVGIAVRESLTAVKDVAVDFSKTDIGKYTMFLVAWKIMAKDIVDLSGKIMGYLVGIPLLAIGLSFMIWSYRRQCVVRSMLIEKGPGFWIWRQKKYEIYNPADKKGCKVEQDDWVLIHLISAAVLIIICCLIIF